MTKRQLALSAIQLLMLIISVAGLSACSESKEARQLRQYIEKAKDKAAQTENQVVPVNYILPTPIVYQPHPYSPSVAPTIAAAPTITPVSTTTQTVKVTDPLLMYPLKSLQFVGTLTKDEQMFAYVMTPDGMMYLVKPGDAIGDNNGKVLKIDSSQITVLEGKASSGTTSATGTIVTMELNN